MLNEIKDEIRTKNKVKFRGLNNEHRWSMQKKEKKNQFDMKVVDVYKKPKEEDKLHMPPQHIIRPWRAL